MHEDSFRLCKELFMRARQSGQIFYAVGQVYRALLRYATAEDVIRGIENPKGFYSVKRSETIVTRADQNWQPIWIQAQDGRRILAQWPFSHDYVVKAFDFACEGGQEIGLSEPGRAISRPGEPRVCLRLEEPLSIESNKSKLTTWSAGTVVLCKNVDNRTSFTSISAVLFEHTMEVVNHPVFVPN